MANGKKAAPGTPGAAETPSAGSQTPNGTRRARPSTTTPKIPLHEIYALPAPLRTFPLPSFYPNNPLSLFHVLWAWANQVLFPPPAEPSIIHQGYWSPETHSVHVRDPKSIRALWEQGFFGKGSYSRSEPNWLKRELSRQGQGEKKVAELMTAQRREERRMMKWDRARKEQEAILKTRLAEALVAPVGPKELLALPNSSEDLLRLSSLHELSNGLIAASASVNGAPSQPRTSPGVDSSVTGVSTSSVLPVGSPSPEIKAPTPKRRKSVRFSPDVESTTYRRTDPPSPLPGLPPNGKALNGSLMTNGPSSPLPQDVSKAPTEGFDPSHPAEISAEGSEIVDREHLQLSPEEAFYLVFALGALTIVDPVTGKAMTNQEVFHTLRRLSCPPGSGTMQPDDPFLVQYAVYHHFRSLGWVPRSGIKFGVDWLLYIGGPVFSHAEFAVIVLPAYTDPYWKSRGKTAPKRSWHWLHSVNRVQSQALKTMVMVYVDIPPPAEDITDPASLLRRYKIREFYMKRWLSNRSR
ncbi:hypothetical protein GGS20DRAFT_556392 [Poronia punctata]|nr:hypothetical protein GGS20DRAFT_556392 [Poronia punctata]